MSKFKDAVVDLFKSKDTVFYIVVAMLLGVMVGGLLAQCAA